MTDSPALILVSTSFPITADGSEAAGAFVSDLALELSATTPVRIVAPGRTACIETWNQNLLVFRYWTPQKPLSRFSPYNPIDLLLGIRVFRSGMRATAAAAAYGPVQHMLALWAFPPGQWVRKVSRAYHVPYSVWTLGSDIWKLGRSPLFRRTIRRILRDAHRCFSDGIKLAEETGRLGDRKATFLPSSRNISNYRSTPLRNHPPYRLLFLGRWHENKGIDYLLEALHLLREDDWSKVSSVRIYGGGPLQNIVHSHASQLKKQNRPVYIGSYLNKSESEEALGTSDYVLIPSRLESIPLIFSDALKLQCPAIAMPVGDLPALISHNHCGILSDTLDATSFYNAIHYALQTPPTQFLNSLTCTSKQFSLQQQIVPKLLALLNAPSSQQN